MTLRLSKILLFFTIFFFCFNNSVNANSTGGGATAYEGIGKIHSFPGDFYKSMGFASYLKGDFLTITHYEDHEASYGDAREKRWLVAVSVNKKMITKVRFILLTNVRNRNTRSVFEYECKEPVVVNGKFSVVCDKPSHAYDEGDEDHNSDWRFEIKGTLSQITFQQLAGMNKIVSVPLMDRQKFQEFLQLWKSNPSLTVQKYIPTKKITSKSKTEIELERLRKQIDERKKKEKLRELQKQIKEQERKDKIIAEKKRKKDLIRQRKELAEKRKKMQLARKKIQLMRERLLKLQKKKREEEEKFKRINPKIFMMDVEEFAKSYTGKLDVVKIASLMSDSRKETVERKRVAVKKSQKDFWEMRRTSISAKKLLEIIGIYIKDIPEDMYSYQNDIKGAYIEDVECCSALQEGMKKGDIIYRIELMSEVRRYSGENFSSYHIVNSSDELNNLLNQVNDEKFIKFYVRRNIDGNEYNFMHLTFNINLKKLDFKKVPSVTPVIPADEKKSSFKSLVTYMMKNRDFVRFHKKKNRNRESVRLAKVASLQEFLKERERFLLHFTRINLSSPVVPKAIALVEQNRKYLNLSDLKILQRAQKATSAFFLTNNLKGALGRWKSKFKLKRKQRAIKTKKIPNTKSFISSEFARFIRVGPKNDVLVLVNLTPATKHARLSIAGKIRFSQNKANACLYQQGNLGKRFLYHLQERLQQQHRVRFASVLSQCRKKTFMQKDLILFRRGAFLTTEKTYARALLQKISEKSGKLKLLMNVSAKGFQQQSRKRRAFSSRIESDLKEELRRGFGMIVIGNQSRKICIVAKRKRVHRQLITRFVSLARTHALRELSQFMFISKERAFVRAQKGQCGALYSREEDLRILLQGLNNIQIPYTVLPDWVSPKEVRAVANKMEQVKRRKVRKRNEAVRKKKADSILARQRYETRQEKKMTKEKIREIKQAKWRKVYGVAVRGLLEKYRTNTLTIFNQSKSRNWISESYPNLFAWYAKRRKDRWEYVRSDINVLDYGMGLWGNPKRKIETIFVQIKIKLKNRFFGKYETRCFVLGKMIDKEFDIDREPHESSCSNRKVLGNWKRKHGFVSQWNVP
ncbi:MAG: hypothetical protein ACJZ47_04020 [bacterium]